MQARDYYFAKSTAISDSGSYSVTIPPGLKIQHLRVVLGGTNGATSNTVGKLVTGVTKLEVLNGSDVLYSLSGRESQAYSFFKSVKGIGQGRFPYKLLSAGASVVIREDFIIPFGRFYLDPTMYLDTSKFQNCTFRITYTQPISATAGFTTATQTLSLIARVIDTNPPPYQGFVMCKEIESFTTSASGDDATILPLDWPYLGIMVAALKTTVAPETIFTNFKLLVNAGQYIPFDMVGTDVLDENYFHFGLATEYFLPLVDTTATWLSDIYSNAGAVADNPGGTGKALTQAVTGESVVTNFTTGQTANTIRIRVEGLAPQASFWLPMSDSEDLTSLFQVQGVNDLRLLKTQAVASAAATVVTAQVRQ